MFEFIVAFIALFVAVAIVVVGAMRKRPERGSESESALRARMTRRATR